MRRPDGEPELEQTLPVPPVYRSGPHRRAVSAGHMHQRRTSNAALRETSPPSSPPRGSCANKRHASRNTAPLFSDYGT
ncbi:hypothetical protein LY76DRAFT_596826 [Colletotrichum caudatum]|nr:hypothetical protein LY76DRAFT_596826 [Colletotrichum caudatum]